MIYCEVFATVFYAKARKKGICINYKPHNFKKCTMTTTEKCGKEKRRK